MRTMLGLLCLVACGGSGTTPAVSPEVVEPPAADVAADAPPDDGCALTAILLPVVDTDVDPDWQPPNPGTTDRRSVEHAGGTATVWVEHDDATVRLMLQRGESEPIAVDTVTTTAEHATRSARSLFDFAIAPHGDGVAVGWRPLVSAASGHERDAELRWRVVDGDGPGALHAEALTAPVLGATTGIGPWPYASSRLVAGTLGERAVFVWQGDAAIRAVVADSESPVDLPGRSSAELRVTSGERAEVTGLDYWCADRPDTHSSSCRSSERTELRCAGS